MIFNVDHTQIPPRNYNTNGTQKTEEAMHKACTRGRYEATLRKYSDTTQGFLWET